MILHIVRDEKFIDQAYESFEKVSPGNSEFMIVSNNKVGLKYIKNTPITFISHYKFLSKKFAQSLIKYDFIIFHALFGNYNLQLIMNADTNIKFVWIGWGADYYKFINGSLYLNKTSELYQSLSHKNKMPIKEKIKEFILNKIFFRDINDKKKVINRINYFAPVLNEEYLLVKNSFTDFRPKFIDWNYGQTYGLLSDTGEQINGSNILIGNSASFTNNHLEAFDRIKKLNIEKRKIIVPLSYGDEIYKNEIIKYGKNIFEDNFYPLVDFMSLNEYNKIISSCSIVIMNHLRQQGMGNIITMMFLGAKIFLNRENTAYQFFKHLGAIIFSMDELNNENICNNLRQKEVEINRKVLKNAYGEDTLSDKTKDLIDIVMKDK